MRLADVVTDELEQLLIRQQLKNSTFPIDTARGEIKEKIDTLLNNARWYRRPYVFILKREIPESWISFIREIVREQVQKVLGKWCRKKEIRFEH